MNPHSRSTSGSRGRSREPRDSYDDDDEDSFESWDSADDDDSYEPESERHLEYKESTEYESDHGSYSSSSEPPTPDPSTTNEYESDDSGSLPEDANIVSMDSVHSSEDSGISTSGDEFANEEDEDEFEDDTENDEDSFGEFQVDDDRFQKKTNFNSTEDESDLSDSDDESDGEERVKLGQTDDDLFWKRYGYSQNTGNFGDNESKGTIPFGDDGDLDEADEEERDSKKSGSDFDDGSTFKDELYSQAFPSIARMRTEDSREEIADPERSVKNGVPLLDKAKDWLQSKWPAKSSNNNNSNNPESPKSNSWFDFSDVLHGNFKWYILGAVVLIVLSAILGGSLSKKNKNKKMDKNNAAASINPEPISAVDVFPSASPTISFAPTLPPGQLMESITFFVMIPNGKDNGITEDEIETEFLAALDVLAPQILFNTTQTSTSSSANNVNDNQENQTMAAEEETVNQTIGLRGRRRERKLKALSIKSPISIDTATIDCPEISSIDEFDLCLRTKVGISVMTDDGTIGFDFSAALEGAIEDGDLQIVSDEIGSNLTIVTLNKEDIVTPSPTMTFSPTTSPPTSSCYDKDDNCEVWAKQEPSECELNPQYMLSHCIKACGMCVTDSPTTEPPTITPTTSPTAIEIESPSSNSTSGNSTSANSTSTNSTEGPIGSPFSNSNNSTDNSNSTAGNSTATNSTTLPPVNETTSAPNSTVAPSTMAPTNPVITTVPPTPTPNLCVDKNEACAEAIDGVCLYTKCTLWAGEGECESNPTYMLPNCAKSCNKCGSGQAPTESPTPTNNAAPTLAPATVSGCVDDHSKCPEWAADDECAQNPDWMLENCKLSCNNCPSEESPDPFCVDKNNECGAWAAAGECTNNPVWMSQNCKQSCNACDSFQDDAEESALESPTPSCVDNNEQCAEWAAEDQCTINSVWMSQNCKQSCNACESIQDDSQESALESPTPLCVDNNERCAEWAADDQCTSNPGWMLENCKQSCNNCESQLEDGNDSEIVSQPSRDGPTSGGLTEGSTMSGGTSGGTLPSGSLPPIPNEPIGGDPMPGGNIPDGALPPIPDVPMSNDSTGGGPVPGGTTPDGALPPIPGGTTSSGPIGEGPMPGGGGPMPGGGGPMPGGGGPMPGGGGPMPGGGGPIPGDQTATGPMPGGGGAIAGSPGLITVAPETIAPSDELDCWDLHEGCHQTSPSGECLVTECEFWAGEGECQSNPEYMLENCSLSCDVCEMFVRL